MVEDMQAIETILTGLDDGRVIPYIGPGVLALAGEGCSLPMSPEVLVGKLTSKASVPHKIRNNLTATAQFIENFKHRSTVTRAMTEAFSAEMAPTALHHLLTALPALPLIVHAWYDDLPQKALAVRSDWGKVQGVSQAQHFGDWVHYFRADGSPANDLAAGKPSHGPSDEVSSWTTLLYEPFGSVSPAANYLVSDSDFVEVLTEIDIQTPIPEMVRKLRTGRNFLFLGCRFATQLERIFAHQIIKRSSDRHWAIMPEEPTRNERRFLAEHGIERIGLGLAEFVEILARAPQAGTPLPVAASA